MTFVDGFTVSEVPGLRSPVVIMAFTGGALIPGAGGAGVGWEAHLAGFAAGVLLIGPFGWLAAPRR